MAVKIIFSDLDGTLLTADKTISPGNLAALEEAHRRGIWIVPATGRLYSAMPEAVRALPFVRYVLTVNGAQVYDCREEKVLRSAALAREDAEAVFAFLESRPETFDCYLDDGGYMPRHLYDNLENNSVSQEWICFIRATRTPVENLTEFTRARNRPILKIQGFYSTLAHRNEVQTEIIRRFPHLSVTSASDTNIEINAPDAQKGAALRFLCATLGIDPGEALAFGDGVNDISMLRAAGTGVAMANAAPSVKAAANYVTGTNDGDGVARAIEKFCL